MPHRKTFTTAGTLIPILILLAGAQAAPPTPTPDADFDGNGHVGPEDVILILAAWRGGEKPTPTPTQSSPEISFTRVPPIGSLANLEGEARNADPATFVVAVYILVGDAWWSKPTAGQPTVPIQPDGTWAADITTGGSDAFATEILAFLLPVGGSPPICNPCYERPNPSGAVASTQVDRERLLPFDGREWRVKRRDVPSGPGPNLFSDRAEDVFVDSEGLHLTLTHREEKWYCTEVVLTESLGYGTYVFGTQGRLDVQDPNLVAGLFTYEMDSPIPGDRELDIEFTRWGEAGNPTNAQFVIQPCALCPGCGPERCDRFLAALSAQANEMTHVMEWTPGAVTFRSYLGEYLDSTPPAEALIHEKTYTGAQVPAPDNEKVRVNYWLHLGHAPVNGQEAEFVLTGFRFTPVK